MSRTVRHRALRRASSATAYVVLIGSLAVTITVWLSLTEIAEANERLRFDHEVQQTQSTIEARLETYISMLRGVAGLFSSSDTLSRQQFESYVAQLELPLRYPEIDAIGFSRLMTARTRAALTESLLREGQTTFSIRPEGARAEYVPTIYMYPLSDQNRTAIGYDMFSDPVLRLAMERARDTGQPAASGYVELDIGPADEHRPAFLIYVPVYRGANPTTLAARREQLIGFVSAPFQADALFVGIFSTRTDPLVGFEVFDSQEPAPETLVYRSSGVEPSAQLFTTTTTLTIADHPWTLRYTAKSLRETSSIARVQPFLLPTGVLISVVLFALVRSLVRARDAAEAAVRVRDEFLSVASHELKTPLTALLGNTELLLRRAAREERMPERDLRTLQVIDNQGRRLTRLIAALLDHTRIEAGHLSIDTQPLDLRELVATVVAETQPTLQHHALSYNPPNQPLPILGDELRLAQVLQNLIDNAAKYSPDGGPIDVSLQRNGTLAELRVADQGLGVPKAAQERLFEQFFRAPNVDPRNISGMGIGLYLTHKIVTLHGGSVGLESREGQGSTFWVRLPLDQR